MKTVLTLLAVVAVATASPLSAAETDADVIRKQIQKIELRMHEIQRELAKLMPGYDIKEDLEHLQREKTVPYELEMKLIEACRRLRSQTAHTPNLDQLTARRRAAEEAYDRVIEKKWFTLGERFVGPVNLLFGTKWRPMHMQGLGDPDFRKANKEVNDAEAALQAELDRLDKVVAADPVPPYESFRNLQTEVNRIYNKYGERLRKGDAHARRLIAEYAQLKGQRARLEEQLKAEAKYMVWHNDVGWIHIGTVEAFKRDRARGSEIWGGRSPAPLKKTALLGGRTFDTRSDALAAARDLIQSLERRGAALAFPKVYYVAGSMPDKKVGFDLVDDPAFADLKKAADSQ